MNIVESREDEKGVEEETGSKWREGTRLVSITISLSGLDTRLLSIPLYYSCIHHYSYVIKYYRLYLFCFTKHALHTVEYLS